MIQSAHLMLWLTLSCTLALCLMTRPGAGAEQIAYAGYTGCVELDNGQARVVIDPNCGGRILEYSWKATNSIWLTPQHDGWVYAPDKPVIDPCGGRFDIGPEMIIPGHPVLWLGKWRATITGPHSCRLTSQPCPATGVQLAREFRLDRKSSHLKCTQTIKNVSSTPKNWCHWSRTLAVGGGIFAIPLNPASRFPKDYLTYGPGNVMNYRPADQPNVTVKDGVLLITGVPDRPKFGFDACAGWLAYLMPSNLAFVKKYPVHPAKIYNEMAAITTSAFYLAHLCELEPIGHGEAIAPGRSVSYTEEWWLLPYPFPASVEDIDVKALASFVEKTAR